MSCRSRRQEPSRTIAVYHRVEDQNIRAASGEELGARDGRIDRPCPRLAVLHLYDAGSRQEFAEPRDIDVGEALHFLLHRIDLAQGKTQEYRAAVADIVYQGIVGVLKAPDGDRFIVVNEHKPENLIYDPTFLGMQRSPAFMLIQVTSTVGNTKDQKLAFYRQIADELKSKLGVRPDDITINMVFVKQEDWSFGRGEPWN
jgi:phenylpyruvate tautomerase PptA (4-oxalocrotonate tautomerase family)